MIVDLSIEPQAHTKAAQDVFCAIDAYLLCMSARKPSFIHISKQQARVLNTSISRSINAGRPNWDKVTLEDCGYKGVPFRVEA